jgi:hypothetical protein
LKGFGNIYRSINNVDMENITMAKTNLVKEKVQDVLHLPTVF